MRRPQRDVAKELPYFESTPHSQTHWISGYAGNDSGLSYRETLNYIFEIMTVAVLAAEKPGLRNFAGGKSPGGLGRPRPGIAKLRVALLLR